MSTSQEVLRRNLLQRRSLPLEGKVAMTRERIRAWYEHWDGMVFAAFSGGKDSRVLIDIIWEMYPDVPAVHVSTGLEYPEIEDFVDVLAERYPGRVFKIRPKLTFLQVITKYGFPVVSKKVSRMLRILREHRDDPKWANSYRLYATGIRSDGEFSKNSKIPEKWRKLIEAPFKISELCCDHLKKEPLLRYERETGRKPITGMMIEEGGLRSAHVTQCNNFKKNHAISSPMLFWTNGDVWEYIRSRGLDYCPIYDPHPSGAPGECRTGCMFCMFGVHLEQEPNRFQRMARTHPQLHSYCMDRLGMRQVLNFIGVPTEPDFLILPTQSKE